MTEVAAFRRQHLPYIQTLVDLDLVREIGLHQARKRPMTLKLLLLKGIASVATVQRRLARLKRLGVVRQSKTEDDKRVVTLSLSPSALKSCTQLGRMMFRTPLN